MSLFSFRLNLPFGVLSIKPTYIQDIHDVRRRKGGTYPVVRCKTAHATKNTYIARWRTSTRHPPATSPINAGSNTNFLSLQVPLSPTLCFLHVSHRQRVTGCRRQMLRAFSPGNSGTVLCYSTTCCSHACPTSTRRECQLQLRVWSASFVSLPALSVTHRHVI